MSKEKQIEEMAKDIEITDYDGCEAWHCKGCSYERYNKGYFCEHIKQAEKLYAKGYRKAAEVAREIFEEIGKLTNEYLQGKIYTHEFCTNLAELKNKYTEGSDADKTRE